jgi:serine phosphatase RsbU (regulator of sigma subunit)
MKVKTKLRLLISLYTLVPLTVTGIVCAESPIFRDPEFQEALTLGFATAVLLVLFGPYLGAYWLLLRQLEALKRFCSRIRNGNYTRMDLPNALPSPEDENEIVALMQDMNWMANQIGIRERQLKKTVGKLEQSNRALERANQRIEEARKALWGEMALARKIQAALLPSRPALPGFEIAADLEPADAVGGDYYDVIQADGCHWLVIGDVSGHGVSAGLIMMMAQTAVHTALSQSPDICPGRLLSIVNHTLTRNIKQLNESKYMSMTVIRLEETGRFTFAGLHQDILVYRADRGDVDTLETHGAWLGLMEDITGLQSVDQGMLLPGDCLLLFTDGLTESLDSEGRMFGHRRLSRLLKANGGMPPEQIHSALTARLSAYRKTDDLTFLILKYQCEVNGSEIYRFAC